MKKNSFLTYVCLIFLIILFTHGCAATPKITKLTAIWKYDKYSGGYLDRIMVVGKPRIDTNRIQYEKYITKELNKRKIDVIPSYTIIPEMNNLSRESIKQAALETGVTTVLVTKVVGVEEKNVIFRQSVSYEYIATPYGMQMTPYISGPRVETFTKVRLETGLFEVESEKLIWAATSAIMNPDSVNEAIKDFSAAIIQQLTKDGYIR